MPDKRERLRWIYIEGQSNNYDPPTVDEVQRWFDKNNIIPISIPLTGIERQQKLAEDLLMKEEETKLSITLPGPPYTKLFQVRINNQEELTVLQKAVEHWGYEWLPKIRIPIFPYWAYNLSNRPVAITMVVGQWTQDGRESIIFTRWKEEKKETEVDQNNLIDVFANCIKNIK